MASKILPRSQLIALIPLWKAPETIRKLQLPISSTGGSWSLFRFSTRLFNTAQLTVGVSMYNWLKFSTGREFMFWTRQSRRVGALGLKRNKFKVTSWCHGGVDVPITNLDVHLLILEYSVHRLIKANCVKQWSYNIPYKLIFYKSCHTIINKISTFSFF